MKNRRFKPRFDTQHDGRHKNVEMVKDEWGEDTAGNEWQQIPDEIGDEGARQNASWNSGPPQGPRRYDAPSRDNGPPPPGGPPQNYSGYDNGPNRRPNGYGFSNNVNGRNINYRGFDNGPLPQEYARNGGPGYDRGNIRSPPNDGYQYDNGGPGRFNGYDYRGGRGDGFGGPRPPPRDSYNRDMGRGYQDPRGAPRMEARGPPPRPYANEGGGFDGPPRDMNGGHRVQNLRPGPGFHAAPRPRAQFGQYTSQQSNGFQNFAPRGRNGPGATYARPPPSQQKELSPARDRYDAKFKAFQNAERDRCQFGSVGTPYRPPSSYVPPERDLREMYASDRQNAVNIHDDDEIQFENGTEPPNFEPYTEWSDCAFPDSIKNAIANSGYRAPRKIQQFAIPLVDGGYDILGQAETGSGKSGAFLLPIIKNAISIPRLTISWLALLSPSSFARKFAAGSRVKVCRAYGEYKVSENEKDIRRGCDILIGTIGRLKHFVDKGVIKFQNLRCFVMDEADDLIETNHYDAILDIIRHPNFPKKGNRQTLLFSATFSEQIEEIASKILREDQMVIISNNRKTCASSKIAQHFEKVAGKEKTDRLLEILRQEQVAGNLRRTLVFVKLKRQTDVISSFLCGSGVAATTVHSGRTQQLREEALRDFRNGVRVLIATDVCARGLDIPDLDHVINYDLPPDKTTYIHRIGRTGRGREGIATSFVDPESAEDQQMAGVLVEAASETHQEIPEFLIDVVDKGGYGDHD
ncbi:hypothetical protein L596_028862 [Steinernema carpocapsae]|uniref:RNA helicase n=1 Tax=Steinernema carpocapsae TaxID=34508 RepID=A0A4U5M0N8_STECR|nr:hypothetical protein L596_028862 [Steinernema carpocapsae]